MSFRPATEGSGTEEPAVPIEICTPQPMLRFYPHRKARQMRLEPYREAWHLLDPPLTIHACVDPDYQ
ncbi:MAG: hypothetical protein ABR874_21040, partial [Candidatus Sulfotelmatobacter sp.]